MPFPRSDAFKEVDELEEEREAVASFVRILAKKLACEEDFTIILERVDDLLELVEHGVLYRQWREHVDDFLQNPKTVSARIKEIGKALERKNARQLNDFATQYAENFTLMHHYAGRTEQLEQLVREHEFGAAEIQRHVGQHLLATGTGRKIGEVVSEYSKYILNRRQLTDVAFAREGKP